MPVDNDKTENLDVKDNPTQQNQETEKEDWEIEAENDPMLADLSEAEEELRSAAKANEVSDEETQLASEDGETTDKSQDSSTSADDKPVKMVPIERLNQVLDKAKTLEDTVNYQKGIIEVQSKALSTKAPVSHETDTSKVDSPKGIADPAKDLDSKITEAENKKIDLAQKYEDGDIGYAEMQKQMVSLDKEIRDGQLARINEIEKNSRKVAAETVQNNNLNQIINQEALTLQENHPYINAIDQLPEYLKNGIWNQITSDAVQNLLAKGINPNDGKPESKVALIREKAILTDKYGPQYAKLSDQQTSTEKPAISETAKNRAEKLELANRQPPQMPKGFGAFDKEITTEQIESMDEDQLADMLTKNPDLLEKATGIR